MKKSILMAAAGAALAVSMNVALAAKTRTGAEVVNEVCAKCHATGENGAPRIGNLADWGPRMSQGITTLTKHAVRGYRSMPAHGGEITVTDLELTRAIIHLIIPKSEAHATMGKSLVKGEFDGKKLYDMSCRECHAAGKNGAPKISDYQAWGSRIEKGIDVLVDSAIKGHNQMPSRGGLASVSDEEVRAAIDYMLTSVTSAFAKQQTKSRP